MTAHSLSLSFMWVELWEGRKPDQRALGQILKYGTNQSAPAFTLNFQYVPGLGLNGFSLPAIKEINHYLYQRMYLTVSIMSLWQSMVIKKIIYQGKSAPWHNLKTHNRSIHPKSDGVPPNWKTPVWQAHMFLWASQVLSLCFFSPNLLLLLKSSNHPLSSVHETNYMSLRPLCN